MVCRYEAERILEDEDSDTKTKQVLLSIIFQKLLIPMFFTFLLSTFHLWCILIFMKSIGTTPCDNVICEYKRFHFYFLAINKRSRLV